MLDLLGEGVRQADGAQPAPRQACEEGPIKNRRARECRRVKNRHQRHHSVAIGLERSRRATQAKPLKALNVDLFVKAVNSEAAEHPHERAPFTFAALPMAAWTARLKCSKKRRWNACSASPPFHSERVHVGGIQTRVVRVRGPVEPIRFSYMAAALI